MIRNPISPACGALLRQSRPAPSAILERCRSVEWLSLSRRGERIEIEWGLGDDAAARARADEIVAQLPDQELALPGAWLADVMARLAGDRLIIEAVLVAE